MLEFEEQQAPVIARAREFVWQHWRNHRRGYLTLTAHSVDAAATSHIFVEQESNGRWRVAWRIVRDSGVIDDLPTYYDVQWVSRGAWDEPGIPLAEGEQPNSRKHILEFRDICGDVESSL